MRRYPKAASSLMFVLLGTSIATCFAGDPATLRYRDLCRMVGVDFDGDKASLPRELKFTTTSTLPTVKPADIQLTLNSGGETCEIPVDENGSFTLPVDERWFRADAMLMTNQPKGSMRLRGGAAVAASLKDVGVGIAPHLKEGRIDYATLLQLARDARKAAITGAARQQLARNVDPQIEDEDGQSVLVLWVTDAPDAATASIVDDGDKPAPRLLGARLGKLLGKKTALQKMRPGLFVIPYSDALLKENPVLSFSGNPSWACCIAAADQITQLAKIAREGSADSRPSPEVPAVAK
jgi:hypothetical protein